MLVRSCDLAGLRIRGARVVAPPETARAGFTVDEVIRGRTGLNLMDLQLTRGDPETFETHNIVLFDAVREVSGKRVIVDSSKRLDRLIPLVDSKQLDVVPIRLVRNPHGVMHSHVKRGRDWRPYAEEYAKGHIQAKEYLRHRPHIKVRYQRLVEDTPSTLAPGYVWYRARIGSRPAQLGRPSSPQHERQ